jgi:hypothetical protein
MEITYDTGAKVILQGPVTYEVESKNGGFMAVGKLTGKVENPEAKGFAVRTPTATVTDLGTEFGVEVSREGHTISHVFRGSVMMKSISADGWTPFESRILHANESARVAKTGDHGRMTVQLISINPATFVRPAESPKPVDYIRSKPFRRWQKYSEQLRKDPTLLAYYDFQRQKESPSVLFNVAANSDHSRNGEIENARWTTGRITGKQALVFNGPNDSVRVNLNQKVDDLTLIMWVVAYSVDDGLTGLLMSDGWSGPGQMHWQLTPEGRMSFGLAGGGCSVEGPTAILDRLHRWMQLAAVYDGIGAKVCVYVDGKLVGEAKCSRQQSVCIGPAQIGCWDSTVFGTSGSTRNFCGRIDELAVFGRAMSDGEVRHLYEEGRPVENGDGARPPQ